VVGMWELVAYILIGAVLIKIRKNISPKLKFEVWKL
jgi:hypothetical protein